MNTQAARHACAYFLARLETEVARLRDAPFPGHDTGPRKWLDFVDGILNTGKGYLEYSGKLGTTEDQVSKLIRDAERLGDQAYNLLTYVAGTDATQIPHQVVAPFQRWVKNLDILNTIFFRAEHLSNYELLTIDARRLGQSLNFASQSLVDATKAINWPVQRVTVPAQAMGMLPHFAVVAHELGHAIQDRIKPNFAPFQSEMTECYTRIEARLKSKGKKFGSNELIQANKIVGSWINELKADSVGHILVGPAFFFALCGFLELAGQKYGISDTHPPPICVESCL